MTHRLTPLLLLWIALAPAYAEDHWVATWTTAQNLVRTPPPVQAAVVLPDAPPKQASAGARGFTNQTVRMIVRTSIPGKKLRVKIANQFGGAPVKIGAAHVALRAKDSSIVPGSDRALQFNGKPSATVGPGIVLLSDPVDLNVPAVADLAISLYFPVETGAPTTHATALHTTYISKEGDVTGAASIEDAATTQAYYYVSGVDVMASETASLIVAYGDSITDGARSNNETNHSWPALLGVRLAAKKETAHIGVANMGIGGNRVLRDGSGASALARLDRDVLSQSGVKWLMLLEGINDIGRGLTVPAETVTPEDLIAAYMQIIERAHSQGIRVVGCTLTPFEGAGSYRESTEAIRDAVNKWIRTGGAFDAVVDFEAATRDPANPKRFRAEFDPGDHLHPNDLGYEAMANAVDLSIFTKKK